MPANNGPAETASNGSTSGQSHPTNASDEDEFPDRHDIIVIGASAGGVEVLQTILRGLPAGLSAAVFIVIHTSPHSPGLLPQIFNAAGPLPASYPENGDLIEEGRVYIAPPDFHMVVAQGIIRLVRGPRENRHRPAIDPLFRSAARHYGPRVIGVIVSGMLDDGTFGLLSIKQRGGIAVVQDPADALYPDMPANAIRLVRQVDHALPATRIGPLLAQLVEKRVLARADEEPSIFEQIENEDGFARLPMPNDAVLNETGQPAAIACPTCHGTLWEIKKNGALRFRCRTGHSYTANSLLEEHAEALESALWAALHNLEENALINRRLAGRSKNDNNLMSASIFMENVVQAEQQAALIKRVLHTNKASDEWGEN